MKWLTRYQEFTGWLPLIGVFAVIGWVVLGGSAARDDLIRWLLELPILTAYALAASGMGYLVWRRWSYRLDEDQKRRLWAGAMGGNRGPLILFVTNAIVYVSVTILFAVFLWPAR